MRRTATLLLLTAAVLAGLAAGGTRARSGEDLKTLVDALGGTDARARGAAYTELVKRKDPAALPLLKAGIPTWDHLGQYYGVLVVDRYPRRQARRTWRKLVQCDTPFVRVWAGMALFRGGDDSVIDAVAEALESKIANATVRYRMLSRVGWPRDERLRLGVRAQLIAGTPIPVLVQVLSLLHRYRDREALPRVRTLLEDPRPGARALAAAWLYDAGETQQATTLAKALEQGIGYAEFVQISRILAANRRVDDVILDAVVARAAAESNVTLLKLQIAFLGQHRYGKARGVLKKLLLHESEQVARAAFDVLVTLTGPLRDDTIGPLLEGDDVDKRLWAAEALRQRDDARGLPVAAEILRTGTVPQRASAATLVASFATDDAVEPLLVGLADAHLDVRTAALGGLQKLLGRLFPYRTIDLRLTGYAPDAPEGERAPAIQALRGWWATVRAQDW